MLFDSSPTQSEHFLYIVNIKYSITLKQFRYKVNRTVFVVIQQRDRSGLLQMILQMK